MADLQQARSAFLALLKDLDPDVECVFPARPKQGTFHVTLSRSGHETVVKVSEKELLDFSANEETQQKIEGRILTALEDLPSPYVDNYAEEESEEDAEDEVEDDEDFEEEEDDDYFDDEEEEEGEDEDDYGYEEDEEDEEDEGDEK